MAELSIILKQLTKLIDSECVYKEQGLILHVQVKGISIRNDMIEITLLPIHSAGFSTQIECAFQMSGITNCLVFRKNSLSVSLICSELFTRKKDVDRLVNFAAGSPDFQSFLNEINLVRKEAK